MDETKKALLSIELDTKALTESADIAKTAIKELKEQLDLLKAAGQENTPVFKDLSGQLTTATTNLNNGTKALKEYNTALTQKTAAEKADNQTVKDKSTAAPVKSNAEATTPDAKPTTPPPAEKTGIATYDADSPGAFNNPLNLELSKPLLKIPPPTLLSSVNDDGKKVSSENVFGMKEKKKLDDDDKARARHLDSIKDYYKKVADLDKKGADSTKGFINQEIQLMATKTKSYQDSAEAIAKVYQSNTLVGKAALEIQKNLGIAEVAMNTEQQLSSIYLATQYAVTQDMKVPGIGWALAAADIAGGVVKATAATLSGAQQIGKLRAIGADKKARGGIFQSDGMGAYLTGPGTGTSDSINAMLSNGESVINARSTQMFGPILSAINQAGGGVAFSAINAGGAYAQGGLFSGSNTFNDGSSELAQTRAINNMVRTLAASLPRQVLVVEDVQASLQNKVMLQNMSNF